MLCTSKAEYAEDAANQRAKWSCRIAGAARRKGPIVGVLMGVDFAKNQKI
jgi:hypothetical protein